MTDILLTKELTAELTSYNASDEMVARAAWVSTGTDLDNTRQDKIPGLIRYLVKQRHGSPFEHNMYTFRINAPIFVAREALRHRIASYNEVSGRYTKLEPKFYIYPGERPLVQQGSSAHPDLVAGSDRLTIETNADVAEVYRETWNTYERLIERGVALEAARTVLPLGVYTTWYVTMNARALMNFLSLRVDHEGNTFTTKPQWEIQVIAEKMEAEFARTMPHTHSAWNANGRIAP